MKKYTIISFYKFVDMSDLEPMKKLLLQVMSENEIKGTLILAFEGVNGTFCGETKSVTALISALRAYPQLETLDFFETYDDINPFKKAKVKLRKEIVTLGEMSINPAQETGIHLEPEQWNQLLEEDDVTVIDTRNFYEVDLGTFIGATNPDTENFRDFPTYTKEQLLDKKQKKIAMFCTGGIRCEKSTAYLKQLGFTDVYQLKGGILNYLKVIPAEKSKWEGSCFVFDERVALDAQLQSLEVGTIDKEWKNNHKRKN